MIVVNAQEERDLVDLAVEYGMIKNVLQYYHDFNEKQKRAVINQIKKVADQLEGWDYS